MSDRERSLASRPRYSDGALPPYSYVTGFAPHPVSDPQGHMYGQPAAAAAPLDPGAWRSSPEYLYAVDLFNQGFYWEAHEAWESLWHAAGRRGPVATWLKALIKLAAAGVKAREGNAAGVDRHARRALQLLAESAGQEGAASDRYCGLSRRAVARMATSLAGEARKRFGKPDPNLLLTQWLELEGP